MEETIAAPSAQVNAIALEGTAAHADMSFISLFANADIIVQLVIIGLVAASFWSWAIMFNKLALFKAIKFKSQRFENNFWSGTSLEELHERYKSRATHPLSEMFVSAMDEIVKSSASKSKDSKRGLKERINKVMNISKNRALDNMENHLGFLATLGSTAPFVGLFGTVWGIMNSFTSIAEAKNISLAVVAPGIAEALFATAIGLVAAIPAVVAYNKLSVEMDKMAGKLDEFSEEFSTLISRQIDEGKI